MMYNLSSVYTNMGQYKLALDFLSDIMQLDFSQYEAQYFELRCLLALTYLNRGSIYLETNKLDSAAFNAMKALNIFKSCNNHIDLASAYLLSARIMKSRNQLDSAQYYLEMGISLPQNTINFKSDIYAELGEVYELRGNFKSALYYIKEARAWKDSIHNSEQVRQNIRAELSYEFEKEKKELELRQKHQRSILDEQLLYAKQSRRFLYIGISVLMLLSYFFLFINYSKGKARKKLLHKNRIILAQKDKVGHFDVSANR